LTTPEPRARWRKALDVLKDVQTRNQEHRLNDVAAGLSFWAILSIFPTVLAFAAILGSIEIIIGKSAADALRQNITEFLNRTLPPDSELTSTVTNILNQSRASVAVVGVLSAIWGVSRGFAGLVRALCVVDGRPFARRPFMARVVGLGLGVATVVLTTIVLLQIVVGPLLGFEKLLPQEGSLVLDIWSAVRWPVLAVLIVLWLATLYHLAPGPEPLLRWRDRLPGALFTMAAWLVVTLGFRLYVSVIGGANPILGVLGGVIVSLTWLYLLCFSTLLGAELNAALAARRAVLAAVVPDGTFVDAAPTPIIGSG
jgi:membrane protein